MRGAGISFAFTVVGVGATRNTFVFFCLMGGGEARGENDI
jgi:hypothetical protein